MSDDFGEPWKSGVAIGTCSYADTCVVNAQGDHVINVACEGCRGDKPVIEERYFERIVACVNFCQHVPTETLEALAKEGVGAATFIQWIRGWAENTEDEVDSWPDYLARNKTQHAEDCLLKKVLDITGKDA